MLTDVLLVGGGLGLAYYLLKSNAKKVETTQGLINYKYITPDGIIELDNLRFRLVIEVEPINFSLRSLEEQGAIWMGYRNLMNTIHLPFTQLIQTMYLNIRDYTDNLKSYKYPDEFKDAIFAQRDGLIKYLQEKTDGKMMRERKYYFILKVDAYSEGVESGIEIDSPLLSAITSAIPINRAKTTDTNELRSVAIDSLTELSTIIRGTFEGLGIHSKQLNRIEVIEMIYQTFNRDMSGFATIKDADQTEAFSLFTSSMTPVIMSR